MKIVDVSEYQSDTKTGASLVPWQALKDHGVDLALIKMDWTTEGHVFGARRANLGIGLYAWEEPILSLDYKIHLFDPYITKYKPEMLVEDAEHYWKVWSEYFEYLRGKRKDADVQKVPGDIISKSAQALAIALQRYQLPLKIYTAEWFTSLYSPQMCTWLKNYDLILAGYYDAYLGVRKVTWDYFTGYKPPRAPRIPSGIKSYWAHQYTSSQIVPGMKEPMDFSLTSDTPPFVFQSYPVQVKATALPWLNIRELPNTQCRVVGKLLPLSKRTIQAEADGWGQIAESQWIYLPFTNKL
jgi:hypothetical protein